MKKFNLTLILLISFSFCSSVALANSMEIESLGKGVFVHKSYQQVEGYGLVSSNGLVVTFNDEAYIIDTPWSAKDTQQLLKWINERNLKLKGSLSTHWHEDSSAGIGFLNARSIPTYTSNRTDRFLSSRDRARAKNIISAFPSWLRENQIQVFYPGPGHAADNLVVWLPDSKILFGGCFIRSAESKTLGNTEDASIELWSSSVEKVLQQYPEVETVVPGHGRSGGVDLLINTKNLAEAKQKELRK